MKDAVTTDLDAHLQQLDELLDDDSGYMEWSQIIEKQNQEEQDREMQGEGNES